MVTLASTSQACARIGGDQVVGLEAELFEARNVEGAHRLADQRELRDQVVRRVGPVRLVVGIDLVAERALGLVEHDREVGRLVLRLHVAQQLPQHVAEAEHGVDLQAVRLAVRAAAARDRRGRCSDEPSTRKTWSPCFTGREAGDAAGAAAFAADLAMPPNVGRQAAISTGCGRADRRHQPRLASPALPVTPEWMTHGGCRRSLRRLQRVARLVGQPRPGGPLEQEAQRRAAHRPGTARPRRRCPTSVTSSATVPMSGIEAGLEQHRARGRHAEEEREIDDDRVSPSSAAARTASLFAISAETATTAAAPISPSVSETNGSSASPPQH